MPAVYAPPDTDAAEPTTAVEVPFWQKYNAHFEFPSSVVLSVLVFTTAFAAIAAVLLVLIRPVDKKPVPVRMIQGADEAGDGSAGSGGQDAPLRATDLPPLAPENNPLPSDKPLPDVKQPTPLAPADPTRPGELADSGATAAQKLFEALRNGLAGAKQGAGGGPGSGSTGQPGEGVGGTGQDNTHKRSLRWALRFSASGAEYVSQLATMGAMLVIPQPPEEKDAFVYKDLRNPKHGVRLAETEWTQLAGQIQFVDTRPDSVRGLADALGVPFKPNRFLAFFPRELEDDLARKERQYRGRRTEDIEETVFRVLVKGGQYSVEVLEQKAKR